MRLQVSYGTTGRATWFNASATLGAVELPVGKITSCISSYFAYCLSELKVAER